MKKLILTAVLTVTVMGSASAQINCDELAMKYDSLINVFVREYSEPLDFVEDYYSFYNRDYIYKDVKIRKHSENKYTISLIEKSILKGMSDWSAEIYYLTIEEDEYIMSIFSFGFFNTNPGDQGEDQGSEKGSEKGDIDARSLYGNPGNGGGTALEMAGWTWDFKPAPDDTSSEKGRIVFEIKIDDQGKIISIKTIEKTLSPTVERIYKAEVEKLTFSKTDNLPPAPTSTGRITFIIKSK